VIAILHVQKMYLYTLYIYIYITTCVDLFGIKNKFCKEEHEMTNVHIMVYLFKHGFARELESSMDSSFGCC